MTHYSIVSHCVSVRAVHGHADAVGEGMARLLDATLRADGCLHASLHRGHHEVGQWMLHGQWAGQGDMDQHFRSPAMAIFSQMIGDHLVAHIDAQTFDTQLPRAAMRRAG